MAQLRQKIGNVVDKVGTALNLPEWNRSETIAQNNTTYSGSNPQNRAQTQWMASNPGTSIVNPQTNTSTTFGKVLGTTTGGSGFGGLLGGGGNTGGGGGSGTPSGQGLFTNFNFPDPNQSGESGVIDSEFNAFNNFLGEQEGLARQQFGNTEGQITGGLENALTQLGGEQGLRTQQLDQTAAGGRQTERLNLARVNQLLQDLQQKDNARIAITGGGSTNEALSDRFARRAQSSVGDVVNEGQRFQNDVAMETERTNQFYETKKSELRSIAQNAINEARLRLDGDLSRIRNERNVAANQKAAANVDAWKNYYNTVRQAQFEIANYQTQLDMWKQQKDAVSSQALAFQNNDIAGMDVSGVMNSFNNTQQPAIGGDMQASAQLPATRVNFGKRGQVDDEEQNLNFLA